MCIYLGSGHKLNLVAYLSLRQEKIEADSDIGMDLVNPIRLTGLVERML